MKKTDVLSICRFILFFQGVIMNKIYITENIKNYKKGREILQKLSSYELIENEKAFVDLIRSKNLSYEDEKNICCLR